MSIEYFLMKQFLRGSQTDNGHIIIVASSPACAQRQFAKVTNTLRRFSDYLGGLRRNVAADMAEAAQRRMEGEA